MLSRLLQYQLQQKKDKLLENLISSFENNHFSDTKIIVGGNEKPEIIYANSFILTLHKYYEIRKPNATPGSMNIIIRFLYGADFKPSSYNTRTLLNTFLLADEMRIMEFRDVLKSYFTDNIITIMEDLEFIGMIILHNDMKKILLKKLCLKLVLLFKFGNQQIPVNIFYKLISMSELRLEEYKLLNRVIQFWSDTNRFRDKKDLIKCIRFNQITDDEIKDIIRRYGNFCLESELLDLDTVKKLITWISRKKYNKCWYKFELLFNTKHDGFKLETFHKQCDGKGSTIVIIELYNNDDLIGGYNPLDWESKNVWKKTKNSFLFRKHGALDGYIYQKFNIKNSFEEKAIVVEIQTVRCLEPPICILVQIIVMLKVHIMKA
ncbi:28753_t:CDS:2 [Gigaspora margarita]|uniref:28753_t:CDS:1 n=1 Tax=Gigaspora margarita TaxID=4874 RepID=A0ABN7V1N7_GIGMA|nr:28753_t:CDS:2 [Gigaspora margarita]